MYGRHISLTPRPRHGERDRHACHHHPRAGRRERAGPRRGAAARARTRRRAHRASAPRPSIAPTSCSARGCIRRPLARRRSSGWSAPARCARSAPEAHGFRPGERVMALLRRRRLRRGGLRPPRLRHPACPDAHERRGSGAPSPRSSSPRSRTSSCPAWARSGRTRARSCTAAEAASGRRRSVLMREEGQQLLRHGRQPPTRPHAASSSAPPRPSTTKTEDFAARVRELTGGRGVDVVLDHIGGRYLCAEPGRVSRWAAGWSRSASWAARRPS